MTKEEKLEKIKLEYALYEVDEVANRSEVVSFIFQSYHHLDELVGEISANKKTNSRNKAISLVLGKARNKDVYFEPSYYDKDNRLLDLGYTVAWGYRRYFYVLGSLVEKEAESIDEVNKLARFTYASFFKNYKGVSRARSIIKTDNPSLVGLSKVAPMDFREFGEFFEGEVKSFMARKAQKNIKK